MTLALLCAIVAFAAFYLLVSVGAGEKQIGVLAQYEQRPGKGCGDKNHEHTGGAPPEHSQGQGQGNQGKDPDETDCKKPPK
jgi:hypothetical protein